MARNEIVEPHFVASLDIHNFWVELLAELYRNLVEEAYLDGLEKIEN